MSLVEQVEQAQEVRTKRSIKAEEKVKAKPKRAAKRATKIKYPEITPDMLPPHHVLVTDTEQLERFLTSLRADIDAGRPIAFDSETHTYFNNPLPKMDKVVGFNFWTSTDGKAWYIPFGHNTGEVQLGREMVLDALKPFFVDPSVRWIGHNLKYDIQVTKESCGIEVANPYFDTMIASQLLNENDDKSLEYLSKAYLNGVVAAEGYKKLFGNTKFSDIPLLVATWYACKDAEATFKLYEFQKHHLDRDDLAKIADLLWKLEMPLLRIVADMELVGYRIDVPYLRDKVGTELKDELERLDRDMREAFGVGSEFNFNSPNQLKELLFDKLGLPNYEDGSTNSKVLEKLAEKHDGVSLLLEHRKAAKIYGTYVEGLLGHVVDGRIYPSFNQVGTATGRFSSSNPNFQNLPSREDRIRKAIVPPPGYLIVSLDFSQIELRVLAALSKDPALLEAYKNGYDLHSHTAALVYGNTYEEYRKAEEADHPTAHDQELQNQRKLAKAANFGIVYGQTVPGFARIHNVSKQEAEEVINGWFRAYPVAKQYLDWVIGKAYQDGYVTTLFGRKRRLHRYVYSGDRGQMGYGERQAMNAPVQGSAADILKIAMVKVDPVAKGLGATMIGTIHDELMFYVPSDITDEGLLTLKRTMETAVDIGVPIECDLEVQTRWGERIRAM